MLDWSEFKKPSTWIGLTGLGVFITLGLRIRFDLEYRLPAIEQRQDRLDTGLHGDMKTMSDEVREQMKAMSATLLGIKTNMLVLCSIQREPLAKTCDVRAIVADATSISRIEAQFLDTAKVTLTTGETAPRVASVELREQLPQVRWANTGFTSAYPSDATKPAIANLILWSSAADSAQWHQEGNTLKVSFANGEASFEMAPDAKAHAAELVKSLNATAQVFRIDLSEKKTPRP